MKKPVHPLIVTIKKTHNFAPPGYGYWYVGYYTKQDHDKNSRRERHEICKEN